MKSKKVKLFRVHTGILLKGTVTTTVEAEKHHVTLEWTPAGVAISGAGFEKFIYSSNIVEVTFETELGAPAKAA